MHEIEFIELLTCRIIVEEQSAHSTICQYFTPIDPEWLCKMSFLCKTGSSQYNLSCFHTHKACRIESRFRNNFKSPVSKRIIWLYIHFTTCVVGGGGEYHFLESKYCSCWLWQIDERTEVAGD